MKFRAQIRDGKININWDKLNLYASRWQDGTYLDVEIVRRVKRRSTPLRAYYFAAVLPPIMEFAGYEPDEKLDLHKFLKIRYFGVEPDKWGIYRNKDIPSVFSDESDVTVPEKKKFVDHVVRKAALLGVYIDDPK